jgi:hypothetical protein
MNRACTIVLAPQRLSRGRVMMHQQLTPEPRHEAANYIVYILGGDGRIRGAEWIAAADDADALAQARRLASSSRCELWQRARRIARLG